LNKFKRGKSQNTIAVAGMFRRMYTNSTERCCKEENETQGFSLTPKTMKTTHNVLLVGCC